MYQYTKAKWVFKLRNKEVEVEKTIYYDTESWSDSMPKQLIGLVLRRFMQSLNRGMFLVS